MQCTQTTLFKPTEQMISKQLVSQQMVSIVARHLEGDYSDTLTRFSYILGASDFLRFIYTPQYLGYTKEMKLLDCITPKIEQIIGKNLQIIDLGPGNGKKAVKIMENLGKLVSHYSALDMSRQMLDTARISQKRTKEVSKEYQLCDFSNLYELGKKINMNPDGERLFLLLGNTLTNEVNMEFFLQTFRKIVDQTNKRKNYFLLGVELLNQNINQIIEEYRTEENYILTFRPLEMINICKQDGVIKISFNEKLRRIEEEFIFTSSRRMIENGQNILFSEGDRVLLSVTYKPTFDEMIGYIRKTHWNIESIKCDENQAMFLLSSR